MIRTLRRSLETAVKRNPNLKKAFYRARCLYHGVRMRIFGSRGPSLWRYRAPIGSA